MGPTRHQHGRVWVLVTFKMPGPFILMTIETPILPFSGPQGFQHVSTSGKLLFILVPRDIKLPRDIKISTLIRGSSYSVGHRGFNIFHSTCFNIRKITIHISSKGYQITKGYQNQYFDQGIIIFSGPQGFQHVSFNMFQHQENYYSY